jgi:hypothetical protein
MLASFMDNWYRVDIRRSSRILSRRSDFLIDQFIDGSAGAITLIHEAKDSTGAEIFSNDEPRGSVNAGNRVYFFSPKAAETESIKDLLRQLAADRCPEPDKETLVRVHPPCS